MTVIEKSENSVANGLPDLMNQLGLLAHSVNCLRLTDPEKNPDLHAEWLNGVANRAEAVVKAFFNPIG